MLYVFQVDTGTMMTFEMRLAMEKVASLKRAIASRTEIAEEKQVLLISGGESLNNLQLVGSYSSAGTDTSPIFLFAKINIESNLPPVLNINYDDDRDIMEMIESCLSMQPSLDTLVARTELAADLNEQASRKKESCERLVHEQHLQQQGWAAVTANLEDLTRAFKTKSELLMAAFTRFIKHKAKHEQLLHKFSEDIKRLDSVPILPLLLEDNKFFATASSSGGSCDNTSGSTTSSNKPPNQQQQQATVEADPRNKDASELETGEQGRQGTDSPTTPSDDAASTATTNEEETKQSEDEFLDANQEETEDKETTDAASSAKETATTQVPNKGAPIKGSQATLQNSNDQQATNTVTLRCWIDYHDNHNSLEKLAELCWQGLERFGEANAEQIKNEVQETLRSANDSNMKIIKGLEERLFTLDKLMDDTKKVVEDQGQLAASFQSNRERFSKVKDSSLLPDLSESHKQQLQIMLGNHKKMIDVRNRCIKAKDELCLSLHSRLRWIMYIEQQIGDLDGKLMIYRENLNRLQRHFEIVGQIHRAPDLYLESVVEALRRRRFTKRYLHWANSVAKISRKLYENEMATRRAFDEKLATHFLSSLFPGLTRSYPPPFATKQPDSFDTNLPRITAADIQYLQASVSDELAKNLFIPRDVPMPHVISALTAMSIDDETSSATAGSSGATNRENEEADEDDDRHSLNPTPPSSPTIARAQQQ